MYRQGDVLIVPVASLPEEALPMKAQDGRIVLALGERTGHAHTIDEAQATLLEDEEARFLQVGPQGALLRHEEHDPISLPAGSYQVRLQREFGSSEEARRRAID